MPHIISICPNSPQILFIKENSLYNLNQIVSLLNNYNPSTDLLYLANLWYPISWTLTLH